MSRNPANSVSAAVHLHPLPAAHCTITPGLLKPERSQSVQELSHMIMQLKKPGIQDGDKQGKCSLCKTGSRVNKIAACSSRARSKIAASRRLMKELKKSTNVE
ncbi:hypothetical protein GH733_019638 [Mirounga leonina]|nr:hypothetical protein GH733_019638 [Mirounga leonina]